MLKMLVLSSLCLFYSKLAAQGTIQTQMGSKIKYVVAKDGSGQYKTLQEAVNASAANSAVPQVIFVKKGVYEEKVEIPASKTNLVLMGEDAAATIVSYGDYTGSGKIYQGIITSANGVAIGTSTSATLYVAANDFSMMNITIRNTAGDVGQAVAFNSNGDRHYLYHCRLIGYQDTYYTWKDGRFLVKDSYIEGAIDYIFGRGVALFDSCQLHSVRSSSYITAAATDQNFRYGYVFRNCKLTAPTGVSSVYLGRPWKAYAQTVFLYSEEGAFLSPAGWSKWSGTTNDQTCFYAEYKCCGSGSKITGRALWTHQLSDAQANTYTLAALFDKNVHPTPFSSSWKLSQELEAYSAIVKRNTQRVGTSSCQSVVADLEDAALQKENSVYPNPFTEAFRISSTTDFQYQIQTVDGREIEAGKGTADILIGGTLTSGIYVLCMTTTTGKSVQMLRKI